MSDDRDRISLVAHAALPMMGPLGRAHIESLLAPLSPAPGRRALDVGGGRADLAIALHDRLGLRVTSVDRSRRVSDEGRRRIGDRAIEIVQSDARSYLERPREVAVAVCLGSTHALDGMLAAIEMLASLLSPDGALIVGDLVRLADLDDEDFGELCTVDDVELALRAQGFQTRARVLVDRRELAAYELAWRDAVASYLRDHPRDPAAEWVLARNAAMDRAGACGTLDHVAYLALSCAR